MEILFLIIIISLYIFYLCNKSKIIGSWGEKKVSVILGLLGEKYRIYNDVLIQTNYGTSQIDHIVISQYGIFVIETKNYKGWIFGGENSEKWTQNVWGNKYSLGNPIKQNNAHINSLKKVLPSYSFLQYVSIIVFSRRATLKVNVSSNRNVIYTYQLINKISSYKEVILTAEQINEICCSLEKAMLVSSDERRNHIEYVKSENLRRKSLLKSKICPRCGGTLIKRKGKYGYFYGCSNYPKCNYNINV